MEGMDKRILIVYYSYEGNTEFVAESIHKITGGDLLRLEVVSEKEKKGFSKYLWGGSQVIMGKKPELKTPKYDIKDYDLVFLGSPIWASSFAPAFNTYLDGLNELTGKDIALFCCHAGSGGTKAFKKLKGKLEGNTIVSQIEFLDPKKNIDSAELDNQVKAWIESF